MVRSEPKSVFARWNHGDATGVGGRRNGNVSRLDSQREMMYGVLLVFPFDHELTVFLPSRHTSGIESNPQDRV